MSDLIPSTAAIPRTAEDDPRIGAMLHRERGTRTDWKVALIGFPSDEGVRRNGGRPGASGAPVAIRNMLFRMTPPADGQGAFTRLLDHTVDVGDIACTGDLEQDQRRLGEVVADFLAAGCIPVILGGGHETAFGHFSGFVLAKREAAILNLDAHTDVRPLKEGRAHSGSPFRQALEHPDEYCKSYMAAGLQPHAVSEAHLEYIRSRGGKALFRDETNITSISGLLHEWEGRADLMVTFDMDAVDQAYAPGVSAPCANGLRPDLWTTAAYLAGRHEGTASFDLSEVNPAFDRDGQTARLAALTIWHFLLGVSERDGV